ncbi:MAG: hypothetical protein K2F96_01575, partial [Muribaculaceae bacterium]|nr:hypothetical protein [Muribaculaceae bacterium]
MNLTCLRSCTLALLLGAMTNLTDAQNVIYPGETLPGTALLAETDGTYTLSNDLLSVSFVKDGTSLKFGGCQALNLLSGSELFVLNLGDGTVVPASAMTLKAVSTETLTANPDAVKGSEKFPGQAIVAEFEGNGLNVNWRAVLRDGSHYFRTEMEISPVSSNVNMKSIVAMLYDVKNVEGRPAPQVVGNTRGAIIASDMLFAGLETPMGKNSVLSESSGLESFTPTSWTPESFSWTPGNETPA